MLSMNSLKTMFRRTYVLKVSSCCGESIRRGRQSVCKMFQTFEDSVFHQTDEKCLSPLELESKKEGNKEKHKNNNVTFKSNDLKVSKINEEYEEAVKALNNLQSNAESLRSSLHQRKRLNSLEDTKRYLLKSGLTLEDLEKLSYIHVSGTKGKGSTCALTDAILRAYGVKTGFYSSPHLVSLTERLRINGQPITKQKFTKYFWPVFNKLQTSQEYENDMPAYFKFLTVLAFHVYLNENVDVVIMEVGIGGELDCTNVIPCSKTVGITSLGLEHTQLLGNTLKEIAWQKAGIIKPNSAVYTSVTQQECLEVIEQRAKEKQATVYRVPEFESYLQDPLAEKVRNKINKCALLNGSLALQLSYDWLRQNRNGFHKDYVVNKPHLTEQAVRGILSCNWPGRCQTIKFGNLNVHLDGAHTVESMQVCANWFAEATSHTSLTKILIFNTTGERDSKKLLSILRKFTQFDLVCFVPNIASLSSNRTNQDTKSVLYGQVEQLKRAQMHLTNWQELCKADNQTSSGKIFTSIVQCIQHLCKTYKKSEELNILVTGSIHLLGAAILGLNEICSELNAECA